MIGTSTRKRNSDRKRGKTARAWRAVFLAVLLAAFFAFASREATAEGMEVVLKDGTKFPAARVAFDGKDFRITTASGVESKKPWGEVLSIEAKIAGSGVASPAEENARLLERIRNLEAENKDLGERVLKHEKALKQSVSKDDAVQPQIRELQTENEKLMAEKGQWSQEKEKLDADLLQKNEEIAILRKAMEKKTPPKVPKPDLEITGQTPSESPLPGATRVAGLIANRDRNAYATVVLEISILNEEDKVLGVAHTFLTNLEPGDKRPFTADIETAFDEDLNVKVVPALAISAEGGSWREKR